jgi:hypothetical protein
VLAQKGRLTVLPERLTDSVKNLFLPHIKISGEKPTV